MSKISLNVTYEVTKTERVEVEIDSEEFDEWIEDGTPITDTLAKEFIESGGYDELSLLLREFRVDDLRVYEVEVCTHVV